MLDGEVWVFDEDLARQFHLLGRPDPAVVATPPVLMAFDCLRVHGLDVRGLPLHRRRAMLEEELAGAGMVFPARRLAEHGHAAWAIVKERGYEGLVGKDADSTYRSGTSRVWLKLKVRHEGAFAIGGIAKDGERFRGLLVGRRRGPPARLRRLHRVRLHALLGGRDPCAQPAPGTCDVTVHHGARPGGPCGSNRSCWRRSSLALPSVERVYQRRRARVRP